ncbi:Hsp70-Hsp90 organizing protein [Actinidia chinensis var. chinensis]|uniref:Hsp70-Hsp90 organizing protein n=1 Tax=Actinidia chinensis var. chinensis TaxID=1590841 RepID=A0A2R6P305_ACTCC|nr:Hsp70-Hsp90 organizing protein [Actinidia chinensis var. chinensis]
MMGLVWFVDVSQVPPLAPPDCVCGRGDFKLKKPWLLFRRSNHSHRRPTTTVKASAATTASTEIRVCTNRTCRRQGSIETLQTLSGIAPPDVSVNSCGCLGRCGAGPNLVVLPQAAFVAHCGTPARAAQIMATVCGGDPDSWTSSLAALALRKRAQDVLEKSNDAYEAERLLSQAIDLKPFGGIHVLYKDRSSVRLVMGNMAEALQDAKEASTLAPKYPEAYICQGDALMAMDQFDAAETYYEMAVELDPSICRSKSFKARVAKLQEKLVAADLP